MDPIGIEGRSVNLYRYCENAPLDLVDESGNFWAWICKIFTIGNKVRKVEKVYKVVKVTREAQKAKKYVAKSEKTVKMIEEAKKTEKEWKNMNFFERLEELKKLPRETRILEQTKETMGIIKDVGGTSVKRNILGHETGETVPLWWDIIDPWSL